MTGTGDSIDDGLFRVLFNSIHFAVFLPVVFALYFSIPYRARWTWLLAASCYFYAAFIPSYLLILFLVIGVDYYAGIAIENARTPRTRKAWLVASLAANIFILAIFKYADFAILSINQLSGALGNAASFDTLNFILPIGLSFHTFQSMSYTIEVYRGAQKAERHLGIYAVYVLYFPQLVAGPIERPQNLLHQFRTPKNLDVGWVRSGLQLMAIGFLKKLVVADNLALLVDEVYAAPGDFNGLSLYLAAVFFSFQILCDFSGYTDIARGVSRLFGIELMLNFRRPYLSTSLSEFWRRWHISLSTWFRDYLYIPLGGGTQGLAKKLRNLMIVFLVSGLWHGANVTFLVWGFIHGLGVCLENLFHQTKRTDLRILRAVVVFHVVTFAWIFFRAPNVTMAATFLRTLFAWPAAERSLLAMPGCFDGLMILVGFLVFQVAEEWSQQRQSRAIWETIDRSRWPIRWGTYIAIAACAVLGGQFASKQFIYFQF